MNIINKCERVRWPFSSTRLFIFAVHSFEPVNSGYQKHQSDRYCFTQPLHFNGAKTQRGSCQEKSRCRPRRSRHSPVRKLENKRRRLNGSTCWITRFPSFLWLIQVCRIEFLVPLEAGVGGRGRNAILCEAPPPRGRPGPGLRRKTLRHLIKKKHYNCY